MSIEKRVKKVGTVHVAEFVMQLQQHFWRIPEELQGMRLESFLAVRDMLPAGRLYGEIRGKKLSNDFSRIDRPRWTPRGYVVEHIGYRCRPERTIILAEPVLSVEELRTSSAIIYGCSSCGRPLAREYFNPL